MASEATIGTKTYQVGNDENEPSYRLNSKNELTAFLSGLNNSVDIERQSVTIEANSRVNITTVDGKAVIEKIFAGNDATLNVYKGSKVKEVTIKKGKKIVFENGKVVKAG